MLESCGTRGPRAVRHRADARLHARREGPQAVEVARQPDVPAGHHQGLRRRHPAPLGGEHGLHRRSAHRPGNPENGERQLPQAAQLAALDARHARALRPRPHAAVRDDPAARPADAASARPSSTARCAKPMRRSISRAWCRALSAFLNTDLSAFYFDVRKDALYCEPRLEPEAARQSGGHRAHLPRGDGVARADPRVHGGGGLGRALPGGRVGASGDLPGDPRGVPRSRAGGAMGAGSAGCARSSPARWRSRARPRRSAPRWRRRRCSISRTKAGARRWTTSISPRSASSPTSTIETGPAPEGAFRHADAPGAAVVVKRADGIKCARSWRYFDPATADPEYPDVTPRDAKALREWKAQAA